MLSMALAVAGGVVPALAADDAAPRSNLRYDFDYPDLNYGSATATNAVAKLQRRIDSGELHLKSEGPRGFLDSLLKALDIDPSSQVLIYSKTSLQTDHIEPTDAARRVLQRPHLRRVGARQPADRDLVLRSEARRDVLQPRSATRRNPRTSRARPAAA